ncbi:MAG: DUF4401 domain-containing protein [Syntrophotaleaceae bacterium]
MSGSNEQLWFRLVEAGVVRGTPPEKTDSESPWYVKLLLAFSGWLAALFFLGFFSVGLQFVLDSSLLASVAGGLLIGGAFAVLRTPKNEFLEHLSLAVSLAGQGLVVFALVKAADGNEEIVWILLALLQALLAFVMPSFVHRVFSSLVAAVAFGMALTSWGWSQLVGGLVMFPAAVCWLDEFRNPRWMERRRAFGYGLVLALILLKGTAIFGYEMTGWHVREARFSAGPWLGELLTGVVVLFVVGRLLHRHGHRISEPVSIFALSGTLLFCIVSMKAQGLSVGLVVLLLGFAGSNRVLQGLGILSLLFYISTYYYLLDATLLIKSLNLLVVGLVLLLLRWLMSLLLPMAKEDGHV